LNFAELNSAIAFNLGSQYQHVSVNGALSFIFYPDAQLLNPQSIHILQPSVIISLELQQGQVSPAGISNR